MFLPISNEARAIARKIGVRASEELIQRVLNNEDYITQLLERITKLEGRKK